MNEPFYTRDGVVITPGMTVYVKDEVYPNPPNAQIVDSVSEDGKKSYSATLAPMIITGLGLMVFLPSLIIVWPLLRKHG